MAGRNGVNLLCYFLLLLSSINAQVTIMTEPMNVTVCLSQSTTANFTCVVNGGSRNITTAGWQILDVDIYILVTGRARHILDPKTTSTNTDTILTETLTITDVSLSDNGAKYRCRPVDDVISDVVTLTVIAPPAITAVEVNEICTSNFTVSWTPASSEEGLSYDVTLLQSDITGGGVFLDSTMDTSYNFTGLTPNTAYTISVASVLNSCLGTSNTIMNTTLTVEAGVPNSVTNLRSSNRDRNTITIVWDPADSPNCGPVLYYTVTIVNSVDATDINTTVTSERGIEFSNLINGTSYNISVAAVNRAGTGPTFTVVVATLTDDEAVNTSRNDGDSGLSPGGIAGIIIAVIVVVGGIIIIIIITVFFLYRKSHNKDGILKSKSPESSSPDESGNKAKRKQANKTEYAELQLKSSGTAPSVDPTKVDYTEVKEHEPLSYAQIQHEPGSGNKPVQGAAPVDYKEVWHQ